MLVKYGYVLFGVGREIFGACEDVMIVFLVEWILTDQVK
jgi:hypothetical protein